MLAVDVGAGDFGEKNIAGDNGFFAGGGPTTKAEDSAVVAFVNHAVADERIILAMIEDREIKHAGVFEGAAHEFVALNAFTVVGDGDDSCLFEGTDGREFFSSDAFRDGASDVDIDETFARSFLADQRDCAGRVDGRAGVGHAHDGGESAARGCVGAGGNCFFDGLAGFAEMDVGIDEARANDEAGDVPFFRVRRGFELGGGAKGGDLAIEDQKILDAVEPVGGIDHAAILEKERFRH